MNYYDNEENIIKYFQATIDYEAVLFVSNNNNAVVSIIESLLPHNWIYWINSSGKNDPPPDFYNQNLNLMMEVMRVDDHAREMNGKIYNPTNAKESKLQQEFSQLAKENKFPQYDRLIINAISGLPTIEDHNYSFYKKNFNRVISHHVSKISNYKTNHPNYKTIFFVFDESSEYVQVTSKTLAQTGIKEGQAFTITQKHKHYVDRGFLDGFLDTDIDYLIWFAPFKCLFKKDGSAYKDMPTTVIYDLKNLGNINCIDYDSDYMMSVEE